MEDHVRPQALDDLLDVEGVANVAMRVVREAERAQPRQVFRRAVPRERVEDSDRLATAKQVRRHVAADETRAAGDQNLHRELSISRRAEA